LLNWSWDLKLQESYTSLSLLLTTLKRLSSGQHTAPTNHQDKKNLPDQNPDSVLFLAVVFGITVELRTTIPLCVHASHSHALSIELPEFSLRYSLFREEIQELIDNPDRV
jgi:hypothetical protein